LDGIDPAELEMIAREMSGARAHGAEITVVVGGGNFVRGAELAERGDIVRVTADYMGMLGTIINALALKDKLESIGTPARVCSALEIRQVAEPFIRGRAIRHLEKGRVVVLGAGTGNPFFTTDTCAALRATELGCSALLKATKVDGVYDAHPKTNPDATRFESLTFSEALEKRLGVLDTAAFAMCQEHDIPIVVFDFKKHGNIGRVVAGESIGTIVSAG
jgi:uridylate kinase